MLGFVSEGRTPGGKASTRERRRRQRHADLGFPSVRAILFLPGKKALSGLRDFSWLEAQSLSSQRASSKHHLWGSFVKNGAAGTLVNF